jgi:hypothetical protein
MTSESGSAHRKNDFSKLIEAGEEIEKRVSSLADAWKPGEELGAPSNWISSDEYFGWYKACREKVRETFGANSKELVSWDESTKGGEPKYDALENPNYKPPAEPENPYIPYLSRVRSTRVLLTGFDSRDTSTLVDRIKDRLKNNKVTAALIVILAILGGTMTIWDKVPEPIRQHVEYWFRPPLTLPGDTGWIFVGYYNAQAGAFIEGPKVEVIDSTIRERQFYVELGDTIRVKNLTKVYMVDFEPGRSTAKKLLSPIVKGVISSADETGVVLPAATELIVRDVSRGAWPGNPDSAIWVRVVLAGGNNGP